LEIANKNLMKRTLQWGSVLHFPSESCEELVRLTTVDESVEHSVPKNRKKKGKKRRFSSRGILQVGVELGIVNFKLKLQRIQASYPTTIEAVSNYNSSETACSAYLSHLLRYKIILIGKPKNIRTTR